ncbi:zinc carboxypeptidase [Neobacillus notoginsengisoli]|uniref:Zinc carboxypeptidase n=1 Tax=Neobacillus notoginsengisoli TaxID=1578198 RepID=A0A417YRG7_9BACI|nr:M14 family metallopeptidase [Neobacillus notoginsengisoli]RHW37994.1 zinc carboxypeptidase [Neobacillus notoginsengisoli]
MRKSKKVMHGLVLASAISALSFTTLYPGFGAPGVTRAQQLEGERITSNESPSIVQLEVPDNKALDKLVEMGFDLTHRVHQHGDKLEVDVVATPSEIEEFKKLGIKVEETLITEAEWNQRTTERMAAAQQEATITAAEDTIKVLQAKHYTNQSATFLYVEAKTSAGATASTALTATWVENGVEKKATLSRFVDYGEYIYHQFEVPVKAIPESVTITSNLGGSATTAVTEWLGEVKKGSPKKHYVKDFVDHYMDPNELYERAEQLAKEFPDLVEIIDMPNKTNGYRRLAQATIGSLTNSAVVVSSKAWGHEGGNDISVEFKNPGQASQPLKVTVDGKKIIVDLATNSSRNVTSTAKQVVDALNANASTLVSANTYRGNAGAGVVTATTTKLTDNLKAPERISREPQTVKAIRIGKHRDGSKPGVLGYAQEHAREWVTPLVTIETAERLLRNYAHDGETKQLVNNLDIFLIPSVNPDGANYSFYDFNMQRRNMTNHCGPNTSDPGYRNSWGVDLNRNHSVGSVFDGFVGASTSCTSDTYAGPSENSEPEARNLVWLADQYSNIKFAMNIHSYGGYFMWSPGAYNPQRVTLPRPTAGQEAFYWAASNEILNDIQDHRGTVILPKRTGPIPDVLYSAAGNSADYLWYEKGIYAWNFEVGADLWNSTTNRWQAVGFQPAYAEGHEEAMEFANGLIGLIKVAYSQSKDKQPPSTKAVPGNGSFSGPVDVSFETSEAATIYYTLDGSRPTFESKHIRLSGTREPAETLKIDKTTVINWFAVDAAGNIEKNYNPLSKASNFNSVTITIK